MKITKQIQIHGKTYCECLCDCGREFVVTTASLDSDGFASCSTCRSLIKKVEGNHNHSVEALMRGEWK